MASAHITPHDSTLLPVTSAVGDLAVKDCALHERAHTILRGSEFFLRDPLDRGPKVARDAHGPIVHGRDSTVLLVVDGYGADKNFRGRCAYTARTNKKGPPIMGLPG